MPRPAVMLVCGWIVLASIAGGCDDEPELVAGLEVHSVAESMVTKVTLESAARRVEIVREREGAPLSFRFSGPEVAGSPQRCAATPALLEALQPVLTIRVRRPIERDAARQRYGAPAQHAFATLQVHDAMQDSRPFKLRILAPAAGRSETVAVLPESDLWFELDGDVLGLLDARCPPR